MTDPNKTGETNIIDKNVGAIHARNLVLESLNKNLIAERDAAIKQLRQANDLIEADTKARLVQEASEKSTIPLIELAGKDIDELETIIAVTKLTRMPTFESGGDVAVKTEKFDPRTYLHTKYLGHKGE